MKNFRDYLEETNNSDDSVKMLKKGLDVIKNQIFPINEALLSGDTDLGDLLEMGDDEAEGLLNDYLEHLKMLYNDMGKLKDEMDF